MTHKIPNHWHQEKLRDLFDFKNGVNAEKKAYGSGIPFINVMEIIKFPALCAQNIPGKITISEEILEKNLVLKGDVLFNRTSETEDEIALSSVYLDEEPVIFGGFVIRGRPKNDKLTDSYKKYCFRSKAFRAALIRAGQGAIRSNIGQKDLDKITIVFPDKNEQQRIVAILETWDNLIAILRRKIELKKYVQSGLAQKLLTGSLRLPNFSNKWSMKNLGDVVERVRRKNSVGNSNILTISAQDGLVHQGDFFGKQIASENLKNYWLLERGEFAYNKSYSKGYPMGAIKKLKKYEAGVVSSLYICFRAKPNVDADYLDHYFNAGLFNQEIGKIAQEGARNHGLLNIGVNDFFDGQLFIPSLDEQSAIANILRTGEAEIATLCESLKQYEEQKNYLLNHLISGRIRTPENMSIPQS